MNEIKSYVLELLQNRILFAAILGWFIAQLLKTMIMLLMDRRFSVDRAFGSGGMPSSHSSCVAALAIAVGRVGGFQTPLFAMAVIFALIVMYDAAGVRRSAGEQAKVINQIVTQLEEDSEEPTGGFEKELKEFIGHTPLQVIFGAILGMVIGFSIPV